MNILLKNESAEIANVICQERNREWLRWQPFSSPEPLSLICNREMTASGDKNGWQPVGGGGGAI